MTVPLNLNVELHGRLDRNGDTRISVSAAVDQVLQQHPVTPTTHSGSAVKEFLQAFDLNRSLHLGLALGERREDKPHYICGLHPSNVAAGDTILGAFEQHFEVYRASDDEIMNFGFDRDLILVGGSNTTLLTRVLLEFAGSDPYQLTRDPSPSMYVKYYFAADVTQESQHVSYILQGTTDPFAHWTRNWHLRRSSRADYRGPTQSALCPTQIVINRELLWLLVPEWTFLLITRLPNFLSDRCISGDLQDSAASWPYVLIIDGCHGIGTVAVELLLRDDFAVTVHQIRKKLQSLGNPSAYQVLLKATDICIDEGVHKAHSLELLAVDALQASPESYRDARKKAFDRLGHGWQAEGAASGPGVSGSTVPSQGELLLPAQTGNGGCPPANGGKAVPESGPMPTPPQLTNDVGKVGRRLHLSSCPNLLGLRFQGKPERRRALRCLLEEREFAAVPWSYLGVNTFLVPRGAVPLFKQAGLQFHTVELAATEGDTKVLREGGGEQP